MDDAAEVRLDAALARVPHELALQVARIVVDLFAPHCDRVEIAGSLRRLVPHVKDIEIVAIPRVERDLLGVVDAKARTELDVAIDALVSAGKLAWRLKKPSMTPAARGPKFKALLAVKSAINVDLFLVTPPAQWGAQYAIRTGPWEYSKHLVTVCQARGLRCEHGRLVREDGTEVATPEERDFFAAVGVPYVEPGERR